MRKGWKENTREMEDTKQGGRKRSRRMERKTKTKKRKRQRGSR